MSLLTSYIIVKIEFYTLIELNRFLKNDKNFDRIINLNRIINLDKKQIIFRNSIPIFYYSDDFHIDEIFKEYLYKKIKFSEYNDYGVWIVKSKIYQKKNPIDEIKKREYLDKCLKRNDLNIIDEINKYLVFEPETKIINFDFIRDNYIKKNRNSYIIKEFIKYWDISDKLIIKKIKKHIIYFFNYEEQILGFLNNQKCFTNEEWDIIKEFEIVSNYLYKDLKNTFPYTIKYIGL